VAASLESQTKQPSGLSWRAFVVRQNLSNCRRKIIDPGARHDDAVAASVSFLGDAQESPAIVLSELHVEMLALYLQFSRLDDVIHFYLRPPTLPHPFWGMEAKSAEFLWKDWLEGLSVSRCDPGTAWTAPKAFGAGKMSLLDRPAPGSVEAVNAGT